MDQTIVDFAIIASVIIGYFISIALVTTSFYKSRANNYLSLSIFLLASTMLIEWYGPVNIFLSYLYFINFDIVIGVLFFTYFLIHIQHEYLKSYWYKWLYAPLVFSIVVEGILHLDDIFHLYESTFAEIVVYIKDNISLGLNIFLAIWGRSLIQKASTISEDKKRWLIRFNLFLILFMASWLLARLEPYIFNSEYASAVPGVIITILSWWILYYGVFRLQIVVQKDAIHQYLVSQKAADTPTKKKVNSTTSSKIVTQLYQLMEKEEVYKNPFLSRLDLATQLGTSEGYLSQIINQEINKSIIQFVNEYRIEAAKKLLHNPVFNKYSVEAVGMEVGFKSKNMFGGLNSKR